MRAREVRDHAYVCLPVVLRVRELQDRLVPAHWRLLRVLLVWHTKMPASTGGTGLVLRGLIYEPAGPALAGKAVEWQEPCLPMRTREPIAL